MPDNQETNQTNSSRINGRFAPGYSGNPLGRPRGMTLTEVMRKMMDDKPGLREALITRLFNIIMKGKDPDSLNAIRFLTERLEGRPAQTLITQPDADQIKVKIVDYRSGKERREGVEDNLSSEAPKTDDFKVVLNIPGDRTVPIISGYVDENDPDFAALEDE